MSYVFENEDILNSAKPVAVFPEYCSYTEATLYIAESCEKSFNELMLNIGVNELAVFESTGSQIIYEGAKLDKFKNDVIKFFQDMWGRIKAFYEDTIGTFIKKIKESNAKKINELKLDNVNFGKDGKKTFGEVNEFKFGTMTLQGMAANAEAILEKSNKEFDRLVEKADEKQDIIIDGLKDKYNARYIISEISGIDTDRVSDACKQLKAIFLGDKVKVDKKYIEDNIKAMKEVVTGKKIPDEIKKSYNDAKKMIDESIKNVKDTKDKHIMVAPAKIMIAKDINNTLNSIRGAVFSLYATQYSQYRNVIVKLMIASASKVKTESVAYTSQLDLLESVLNF